MCDPIVTHGPYMRALEMWHYKALYKFTFFTFYDRQGKSDV